MKYLHKILSLLLVASLFFYACQDNEDAPVEVTPGAVQFSLSDPEDGTRGNAAGAQNLEDARSIVLTIIDYQGTPVYSQEQISVFNFSGTMVTEPISLNPGNYQLTEFLVLDDQGAVIYATPLEGSEYAHLVDDPLPIDFAVAADVTTQVVPEVIDTSEFTPDDFGYASFRFVLVEHFNFLIAAFVYDDGVQGLVLTTSDLTVMDQATGSVLYSTALGDTTNIIAVRDGYDYTLLIEKTGFTSVTNDYSNAALKAFASDPLEVVMETTGTLPSNSFTDRGQAFSTEGTDVASGDLDGDGDLDFFITRSNGQANEVWLNDGSGNFTNSGQALGTSNSHHVALGDVDGDGDLDAYVVNYSNQVNRVWLNDGAANFTDSGQGLGTNSSMYVALADMDADGDLDAIVANDGGNSNTFWLNDGNGNFTSSGQILGITSAHGIAIGDIDSDGDLDVFLANYGQPNTVWLNDGNGGFTDSGQGLGNTQSERVELGDLDGDGDLDAFVASHVLNSTPQPSKVWFNNGAGVFTDSGQSLGNFNLQGLILIDYDLDGDLDALTVSYYLEPYTMWQNDGSGLFTDSGLSFGTHFATGIVNGDFDGDGDQDLFATNSGSSHILWLGQQ